MNLPVSIVYPFVILGFFWLALVILIIKGLIFHRVERQALLQAAVDDPSAVEDDLSPVEYDGITFSYLTKYPWTVVSVLIMAFTTVLLSFTAILFFPMVVASCLNYWLMRRR